MDNGVEVEKKNYDEALHAELVAYRSRRQLTMKPLARLIGGTSETTVSRYLSCSYEGNVQKLEGKIRELLRNEGLSETSENELFKDSVSAQIEAIFKIAMARKYINVIYGKAGIGKTCAIELYMRDHPRTVLIKGAEFCSSISAMEAAFFDWEPDHERKNKAKRMAALLAKFKNSDRLIIVDNAHLLTRKAIGWLISFWQETHSPMVLVGNPEITQKLLVTDQWHSRVGNCYEIVPTLDEVKDIAFGIVKQLAPEISHQPTAIVKKIGAIISMIAEREGAFRSLCKRLVDAKARVGKTDEEGKIVDWPMALQDACSHALYHYSFTED